jgi:hypothetical protein
VRGDDVKKKLQCAHEDDLVDVFAAPVDSGAAGGSPASRDHAA